MFRPNRIGSPYIHTGIGSVSTTLMTIAVNAVNTSSFSGNIINATAQADFGSNRLQYQNATNVTIPAYTRAHFGQQFAITPPISGDAVGIEISGSLILPGTDALALIPFLAKLATPASATLEGVNFLHIPTYFASTNWPLDGGTTDSGRALTYKEQLVIQGDTTYLSGTWAHGVAVYNWDAAGSNFTWFTAGFAIRQLNDQQNIGYRDTRR